VRKSNEDQIVHENHQTPLRGRLEIFFSKKKHCMPNNMAFEMFFYGKILPLGDKKRTYEGPKEI
jgi:hypothetical protein